MFVRPPIPMRHPEQAEAVRGDGSLAAAAVEEGVRYDGPTQAMVRIATDEVEIGGTSLPRGARIFTMRQPAGPRETHGLNGYSQRRTDAL